MAKSKKPKKTKRKPKRKQAKRPKPTKRRKKRRKRRKRRKPRPTKLVFQNRPRDEEPPADFDINLGAVIQDEAYATILARFQDAAARLPETYAGRVNVVPMADGSVDGELFITLPEGADTREAEFDLYEAFGALAVGTQYWVSMGLRYVTLIDDESYRRNKGQTEVQTNYQRATGPNIVEEHLVLRQHMIGGMETRLQGEQAHSVFIRLHWNPTNEQPKR